MTRSLVDVITATGPAARLAATGTVQAVSDDGTTVDVQVGGALVPGTPRLETYTSPAAGDAVLLLPTARGWVALARFATS